MQNNLSFAYEDEGELFEFDNSADEIPEADRQPPAPPLPDYEIETKAKDIDSTDDKHKDTQGHPLSNTQKTTLTNNDIIIKTEDSSFTTGLEVSEHDSPSDNLVSPAAEAARGSLLGKVNPYLVVDIAPLQEQSPIQKEDEVGQEDAASARVPSGYSVPVPCGYTVPSKVPLILPAYSTPVIIRHLSVDEEDPDEVIYDDVPRENSDSTTDPDEMIYDDVELGEEGGNSSPENGWSASEFESYGEQSDTESKSDNGIPDTFLRGKSQKHKMHHCQDSSCDCSTLYGLMMKPIQRFPQFILLLQDMLKNTPKGHPDRIPLQMALTELETLAEKLNERKREADQRCEIKQIANAMNERYLNKLLSSGSRYLICSDDMVETVYNEKGEFIKTKERRLFLLNDVLMCATINVRSTCEGSGIVLSGQKYLLKWSVPLSHVDVVEFGGNEELGENSRYPARHSGEKVVLHAKPCKLYMGPGQLYQDLQNVIHDLNLVNQITQMIGNLKGNYQNLNQTVAQDWISGLQRLIFKKEEEIRAADQCRIQLQLPGRHDKSGSTTFFTAVFNTFTPSIKQSWISSLQMAKLALEEENQQGWFFTQDDGNRIKKQKHPLLVGQIPVVISKLQEFKVACAVHNPEPYCGYDNVPDSLSMGHGCLWVASCTNQMGQISIVTLHNSNPKVTECFNVESRIVSMVHIINEDKQEVPETCPDSEPAAGKATDSPTICLGMEEGRQKNGNANVKSLNRALGHYGIPLCGVLGGPFLMKLAARTPDGSWNSDSPKILQLGVLPVKSVLAMEDTIWASSGGQLSIIGTKTHIVERQLEAHQEEGMAISHMAVAGVGIWIAFSSSSTLRLFHTETLEHLQDINIATPIHNMLPGQLRVSVTSLLVCHGLLMAGTNLGIIVALPVPRLQGIPKVTGRGMVSYHAHTGPVKFLTMAAAVSSKKQRCTLVSSAPSQPEGKDGEQRNCSPEGLSSLLNTKDKGVWLGDSTKSIAQQSTLSASSGSLAPSHESLEHGPEDGTIYELLNDPSFSQSDKRSKKMTVSSVLVVSGGLGHRRVNKKSKQQRQDETVSTIMVWQIPLLNI
ncbi:UNVERIFIED_CONTAM: hypothetical protein FKN15_030218 [Acipenser sinensis]